MYCGRKLNIAIIPTCTSSPGFGHCIVQLLLQFGDACVKTKPQSKNYSNSHGFASRFGSYRVRYPIFHKCKQSGACIKRGMVTFQRLVSACYGIFVPTKGKIVNLTNKFKNENASGAGTDAGKTRRPF